MTTHFDAGPWQVPSGLDRRHLDRERIDLWPALLRDERTVALWVQGTCIRVDSNGALVVTETPTEVALLAAAGRAVYLGELLTGDSRAVVAVRTEAPEEPESAVADAADALPGQWMELRAALTRLSREDLQLAVAAMAQLNWLSASKFSPSTGEPAVAISGGWVRRASRGGDNFPRTDAAVITRVRDASDRLLLASNVAWPDNMFSLVAGFVEPGESLEQAVEREVLEEAGVRIGSATYCGSQPWPFPASLMVGFDSVLAEGSSPEDARPDGIEIRAVRWFTREELLRTSDAEIRLPARGSIAYRLISEWLGRPIADRPVA